jgi:hypothetical protein
VADFKKLDKEPTHAVSVAGTVRLYDKKGDFYGMHYLESNTPPREEDFSEENLAYRISAKEFFKMISSLNERITSLEEEVRRLVWAHGRY